MQFYKQNCYFTVDFFHLHSILCPIMLWFFSAGGLFFLSLGRCFIAGGTRFSCNFCLCLGFSFESIFWNYSFWFILTSSVFLLLEFTLVVNLSTTEIISMFAWLFFMIYSSSPGISIVSLYYSFYSYKELDLEFIGVLYNLTVEVSPPGWCDCCLSSVVVDMRTIRTFLCRIL